MANEQRKAFKDWFDAAAARKLGQQVRGAWPDFPEAAFVREATQGLDGMEFHERIASFSRALRVTLPDSPDSAYSAYF